jgi:WD40 repeat protein
MLELATAYKILGLKPPVAEQELKKAYRSKAQQWHPDRFIDQPHKLAEADQKFRQIKAAYDLIKEHLNYPASEARSFAREPEIKVTPKTAGDFYQAGVEKAKAEDWLGAIEDFSLAIHHQSDYIEAYQYRAFVREKLGFNHGAAADFKRVKELKYEHYWAQRQAKDSSTTPQDTESCHGQDKWHCLHTLERHLGAVNCLALDQKQTVLFSGGEDGLVKLWDLPTAIPRLSLDGQIGPIEQIAVGQNRLVAAGKNRKLKVWHWPSAKLIQTWGGWSGVHHGQILALKINLHHQQLMTASRDRTIKLWDLTTGKQLKTIKLPGTAIVHSGFSPNGYYFYGIDGNHCLHVGEVHSGKIIKSLNFKGGIRAASFNYNGNLIALADEDHHFCLYSLDQNQTIWQHKSQDSINAIEWFSTHNSLITSDRQHNLTIWEHQSGTPIHTLPGHNTSIQAISVIPKHNLIVSASRDRAIKIWSLT